MSEYTKWNHISPIATRFIEYVKYYRYGSNKKLRLVDVLNKDLNGKEYFNLTVELALAGYELRLIEGKSKYRVGIGLDRIKPYSYFELIPSELCKEADFLKEEIYRVAKESTSLIKKLRIENEQLKDRQYKKIGPKPLGDECLVKLLYNDYLSGKSLGQIVDMLSNSEYKTKRGGKWQRSTIKSMLNNYQYVEQGFVSEDTFGAVQSLMKNRRKNVHKNKC